MSLNKTSGDHKRPLSKQFACLLAFLTVFAMLQPALAQEFELQFELPSSEVLTYKLTTVLFPVIEPGEASVGPAMLELSAILNVEIEPLDANGGHPFTYWFDTFHVAILGLPFNHLLGPEKWSGTFTPHGELLSLEEPAVLSELGIAMDLVLADLFLPAPQTPMSIGDSWQVNYQLTTGANALALDISDRYTLLSYDLEAGTAHLLEETSTVYESELEVSPGVFVKMNGEVAGESQSTIDLQTGQRLQLTGRAFETLHLASPVSDTNEVAVVETTYFVSEVTLERIWPAE